MHGSGWTPNVVATDLTLAFRTAVTILFHASLYQLANRVTIQQTLGKSEVCCLHSDTGDQITGSLLSALRYESHRQGWFEIQVIRKVRHTMVHDAEYHELLWIATLLTNPSGPLRPGV